MALRRGSDIQERAFGFAAEVVALVDVVVTRGVSAREIGRQLLRAAASVGANLEEADAAQSRPDFVSKCGIALKEARESHYWLRLLARTGKITERDDSDHLLTECNRIVAILTTIVRKSRAQA